LPSNQKQRLMSQKMLGMKWLKRNSLFAAALLLSVSLGFGGDPIQFSGGKAKSGPQQERKVDSDLLKSFTKDTGQNPFLNSLTPLYSPSRNDSKDEKRLKKEREDARNWLLKDPDEKDKTRDLFGADEFAEDEMEGDDGLDVMFAPLVRNKGTGRNASAAKQPIVRPTSDTDATTGRKAPEAFGAHTSRELNLKNLLDTSQAGPARSASAEPSLFEFLRENAAPTISRDQATRKEQFEKFLNPSPSDSMQPRMMDPINFAPDLTQQRINPVTPSAGPSPFDAGSARPQDFSPKRDWTFDPRTPASRPQAPSYVSPNAVERNTRPSVIGNGSMFNNNPVRRPGT
jgi:hypothetical protein